MRNTDIFPTRLKELRSQKGISQIELANALNMSIGAVGNWETGKRKPDVVILAVVADYFDVSLDYLVGRESTQKEKPADNVGEPMSHLDKELYDLLSTLSVEEKEMLLASIKAVKSRREQPASPQQ